MSFSCATCNFNSKTKQSYLRHLTSKKHTQRIIKTGYKCTCGNIYMSHQSLYLHKKTSCIEQNVQTTNQVNQLLNENDNANVKEEIKELKQSIEVERKQYQKERDELRFQIGLLLERNVSNTNQHIETQNNNNITININAFGKENTDYLDERTIVSCIDRIYKSVPAILEKIHFDPEHPENHNIKITNKKLSYASVMGDNQKWKMVDRKDAIESMVFNGYNLLDEKYPETKQYVSESKQTHFENFQERFINQDKDLHKQLKTEVDLLVLNS